MKLAELVWRNPLLRFALCFTVLFGTGVGLATTNMGTLSRYRIPLMPLFGPIIFYLYNRAQSPRRLALPVTTPAPAPTES
jgi:hypothetical protein